MPVRKPTLIEIQRNYDIAYQAFRFAEREAGIR